MPEPNTRPCFGSVLPCCHAVVELLRVSYFLLPRRLGSSLPFSGRSAHARFQAMERQMRSVPGWQPLEEPQAGVFVGDQFGGAPKESKRAPVAGGAAHRLGDAGGGGFGGASNRRAHRRHPHRRPGHSGCRLQGGWMSCSGQVGSRGRQEALCEMPSRHEP